MSGPDLKIRMKWTQEAWAIFKAFYYFKEVFEAALIRAYRDGATYIPNIIRGNIRKGGNPYKDLSGLTIELKGHSAPLIESGRLHDSITATYSRRGVDVFVGDPEVAVYADVMEFGATIRVTDAMRRFFLAIGHPLRSDTKVIEIPARPFMRPSIEPAFVLVWERFIYHYDKELVRRGVVSI